MPGSKLLNSTPHLGDVIIPPWKKIFRSPFLNVRERAVLYIRFFAAKGYDISSSPKPPSPSKKQSPPFKGRFPPNRGRCATPDFGIPQRPSWSLGSLWRKKDSLIRRLVEGPLWVLPLMVIHFFNGWHVLIGWWFQISLGHDCLTISIYIFKLLGFGVAAFSFVGDLSIF